MLGCRGKRRTNCHPERSEGSRRSAEIPRFARNDNFRCCSYGRGLLLVPLLLDGGGPAGREPCDDDAGGDAEGGGDILGDELDEPPLLDSPLLRDGGSYDVRSRAVGAEYRSRSCGCVRACWRDQSVAARP